MTETANQANQNQNQSGGAASSADAISAVILVANARLIGELKKIQLQMDEQHETLLEHLRNLDFNTRSENDYLTELSKSSSKRIKRMRQDIDAETLKLENSIKQSLTGRPDGGSA